MKVKVLNRPSVVEKRVEDAKILTSSYVSQLNRGIAYRIREKSIHCTQDDLELVVGGKQKVKTLNIKCK